MMWVTILLIVFFIYMGIMIYLGQRHDERMEELRQNDRSQLDAPSVQCEDKDEERMHP